jgi:hypothetical protein
MFNSSSLTKRVPIGKENAQTEYEDGEPRDNFLKPTLTMPNTPVSTHILTIYFTAAAAFWSSNIAQYEPGCRGLHIPYPHQKEQHNCFYNSTRYSPFSSQRLPCFIRTLILSRHLVTTMASALDHLEGYVTAAFRISCAVPNVPLTSFSRFFLLLFILLI